VYPEQTRNSLSIPVQPNPHPVEPLSAEERVAVLVGCEGGPKIPCVPTARLQYCRWAHATQVRKDPGKQCHVRVGEATRAAQVDHVRRRRRSCAAQRGRRYHGINVITRLACRGGAPINVASLPNRSRLKSTRRPSGSLRFRWVPAVIERPLGTGLEVPIGTPLVCRDDGETAALETHG
jgi:hypothetical protein